ncbi:hypothetical protein PR048_027965 [Dryococelus australis]|uniref:Uncharacterized protein n=1 Tax=Dryococelus australis TaxID=614101 RepID=A0ABQ9GHZ4_9NEOP|nr:hypothetical protein PR048_027965 [Dryococelus australis]
MRYKFVQEHKGQNITASCHAVGLLATHQCEPGSIPGQFTPDFRKWESCRTMPLVCGFSRGAPVSPAPSFWRCSILISITITLIDSQDLAVMSHPNLFTYSRIVLRVLASSENLQLSVPCCTLSYIYSYISYLHKCSFSTTHSTYNLLFHDTYIAAFLGLDKHGRNCGHCFFRAYWRNSAIPTAFYLSFASPSSHERVAATRARVDTTRLQKSLFVRLCSQTITPGDLRSVRITNALFSQGMMGGVVARALASQQMFDFRRCSIPRFTLIGSQDLDYTSRHMSLAQWLLCPRSSRAEWPTCSRRVGRSHHGSCAADFQFPCRAHVYCEYVIKSVYYLSSSHRKHARMGNVAGVALGSMFSPGAPTLAFNHCSLRPARFTPLQNSLRNFTASPINFLLPVWVPSGGGNRFLRRRGAHTTRGLEASDRLCPPLLHNLVVEHQALPDVGLTEQRPRTCRRTEDGVYNAAGDSSAA